jgi:hypothetical protein
MSRSRRARLKERKRASALPVQKSAAPQARPDAEPSRFAARRRRAHTAKIGLGAAAMISLGTSMGLARVTYAGHSKHPVRALSIPQPLYLVVRQNLLQAGILAPATAPPDATTSTS